MKFLIIDSHPLMLQGYTTSLKNGYRDAEFFYGSTLLEVIDILNSEAIIDVVLMDCNIGGHKSSQINNGIEWIRSIKQIHVSAKVLFITEHKETLAIYKIHKKVLPDGLLVKSDVSLKVLSAAVECILGGKRYYSKEVIKILEEMSDNVLMKECRNIEILTFLSQGYKVSEISELLFISEVAVYRRVNLMKKNFRAADSIDLIKIAVSNGFV